jgi:plasmid stabilization system protein ParE
VVERLTDFPASGRPLPEFPQLPYRELIIGSYRCIYRYDGVAGNVMMVTVVHGSRLLVDVMLSEI